VTVEILNESGVEVGEQRILDLTHFAFDRLRVHPQAELTIKLVDEPTILNLKQQWWGFEEETDVLSFPMDELRPGLVDEEPEEGILGDIALAPVVAQRQGEVTGHGMMPEIELLVVHGILHLLGYDHEEPAEHEEMFTLQAKVLADFGSAAIPPK
jgi:probable rRNA maturation factor